MKYARIAVLAFLGIVTAYLLFFVQPEREALPGSPIVITYWEKWGGEDAASMEKIVADFNNTVGKQKGIYVQYLSMSNVDQKTLVATAAGVPPDVAGLWNSQVAQFAEINALEPLDAMAQEHGITADYYKPVLWDGCRYQGQLWALVSCCGSQALYYNKKTFAERASALRRAGLDPDRPPRTLKEMDRYAAILDEYESLPSGFKRLKRSGFLPMEPGWYLGYIGYWFGAFNSTQNPFIAGTVAMEMQGPWMTYSFEKYRPEMDHWKYPRSLDSTMSPAQRQANCESAVAPFPAAIPGLADVTYTNFDVLMIPRGSRHKKEAFEFIAFVNSQAEMEKLNILNGQDSPLRQVSRHFVQVHPNPYINIFERLLASPHAHGVPPCPIWPEVGAELDNATQRVSLLEATPAQALQDAQQRVDAKYKEFKERRQARQRSRQ